VTKRETLHDAKLMRRYECAGSRAASLIRRCCAKHCRATNPRPNTSRVQATTYCLGECPWFRGKITQDLTPFWAPYW